MRRLVRAVWSLTWLGALLVGLPVVLIRYVGWYWPHGQEWRQWVMDPMIRPVLIDVVAIIIWLLWGLLLYGLTVDVVARIRRLTRGSRLHLPSLPTPMQATASGLIGATVLSTATSTAAATPVLASPPAPATATMTDTTSAPAMQVAPGLADARDIAGSAEQQQLSAGVVTLPDGGWISHHTAVAIDAAAAMAWWQRRRRYLPQPPTGPIRTDRDLTPLPATVTTIQHQLHPLPDDETPAPEPGLDTPGGHAAIVESTEQPLAATDLPAGGLGLLGPAAADAARGILIAALLTGPHPDQQPRVITTSGVLAALLAADLATQYRNLPGLHVASTMPEALATAETVALQDTAHHPAAEATQADHDHPPRDRRRPVVLILDPPDNPDAARRLAVLLRFTHHLGVTGVLLGPWPHGSTWCVDPQGGTHPSNERDGSRGRLSVLGVNAATDLLALLWEARTGRSLQATPSGAIGNAAGAVETPPTRRPPAPDPNDSPPAASPSLAPTPRLRLRVLGTPGLYVAGNSAPVRFARTAALPILVFLAVHPDGATTSELTTALWPQLHVSTTAHRVHTIVSSVRTTLEALDGGPSILRVAERYRLDPERIDVDLWRLHDAVQAAATAVDPTDHQRGLRLVVEAYTGELADGSTWPWLQPHREATRRHVVDAYVSLATHDTDPKTVLALLQAAVRTDPANHDLRQRARRAHAAANPTA